MKWIVNIMMRYIQLESESDIFWLKLTKVMMLLRRQLDKCECHIPHSSCFWFRALFHVDLSSLIIQEGQQLRWLSWICYDCKVFKWNQKKIQTYIDRIFFICKLESTAEALNKTNTVNFLFSEIQGTKEKWNLVPLHSIIFVKKSVLKKWMVKNSEISL